MGWEEGGAIGNRGQSRDWKGVKKGGRSEEEGEREGGCHKENGRQEEGREGRWTATTKINLSLFFQFF